MAGRSLRELLEGVPRLAVRGSLDVEIQAVRADSRAVQPGDLFVCLPGYKSEGGEVRADRHDFIPQALARGAAALVVERDDLDLPPGPTVIRVADAWSTVAAAASAFYRHPSKELALVGVTGTSGKTSTTYFIESVLARAGHRTGRLGTIEYKLGDEVKPAAQTTPEAHDLQQLLRRAVEAGVSALVMEVSSHALELRRVGSIAYDVGVFTNLSQDHLNFHPDMDHYRRAKGRLFEDLGSGGKSGVGVVNLDDAHAAYFLERHRGARLTYGVDRRADVRAESIELGTHGARFLVRTPAGDAEIALTHRGDYSIHNALAAIATGVALGLPLDTVRQGIAATPQVPGRFEAVDCGQDFLVAVDYAHKPGALERVLESALAMRPQRVITVFGCGGDRDRGKRPLMGAIAARLSDFVVVTSDNPRSEDPEAIIGEILGGIPAGTALLVEADRARAIHAALGEARRGDIVIIAGKGHENYQILGERRIHFDDREVAREALRR